MQSNKEILVDLYYDVSSPFAWIGFEVLLRYNKKFSNMKLRLRPISLVSVGKATGNQTPLNVPAKAKYFGDDLKRLAKYYQLPLQQPKDVRHTMFVKGTFAPLCLLTVVSQKYPNFLENLSRAFFLRTWSRDVDAISDESLKEACVEAGLPQDEIESLILASKTESAKQDLQATVEEALKFGAFGVPTYVAHFEDGPMMFFGTDRFFLLAHYLGKEFPGLLNDLNPFKV